MDELEITNISEFQDCLNDLQDSESGYLYRGQPDAQWPVCCSAVRRLSPRQECTNHSSWVNHKIVGYSEFLLSSTKMRQFFPPEINDETDDMILLAHLQHQGAATALIDFTRQPLVALLFACIDLHETCGAVFVLPLSNTREVNNIEDVKRNVSSFFESDELWAWEPPPRSNRVVAQNSVFIFGVSEINPSKMLKITVQADSKDSITQQLESKYGISEERMVLDYSGFAKVNAVEKHVDDRHTVEYWRRLIEEGSDPSQKAFAYYNYGIAHLAISEWSGAVGQFDEAIANRTDYEDAFHMRGLAKANLDLHQDAIEDFSEAIRINPNNYEAFLGRGISKRALGQVQAANQDFTEANRIRETATL